MNNNFYNIPMDWYNEFNTTFMNPNSMESGNNQNLANVNEGFLRGNLFNNLYEGYKNYQYGKLKPSNKREELLYNILKYKFALKELDLYLDTHPTDQSGINLYNQYLMEERKLCDEYEKSYGPITLDSPYMKGSKWVWIQSPWPWEVVK